MGAIEMNAPKTLQQLMQKSGVAFGTSGARGLVTAMTEEVCAAYTQAFVQAMQREYVFKTVAIATDLRPSSPVIAQYCSKMLFQLGLEIIFCGAIPTPALALYAQKHKIPGIMVTGSHIPFDRNGLKFYRPDGEITKADEEIMLATSVLPLQDYSISLPLPTPDARSDYLERYVDMLGADGFKGLRLAIYQHSSVGRDLMQELFSILGAEVICLERSNTFVPIDTEAVSDADVQRGIDWAKQYNVNAIISTDGDGDRPLIADEHGTWLRGDIVGLLTAQWLNIRHLAVPVSCNSAIEVSRFFDQVIRTRIGSPYVIAGMALLHEQGKQHIAGFEANGGFLLGSSVNAYPHLAPLPTRDALLPVMCLLAAMQKYNKPLSTIVAGLPSRFTASDRLQQYPTEKSKELIEDWFEFPEKLMSLLQIDEMVIKKDITDGLRLTLTSGNVIHLRPSGNAPELRCYAESHSIPAAVRLVKAVLERISTL
ncbi:phosphomannomutase [Methylophilus sp. YYY-1]|uniref:phosphomannomutase n=1 Tax=Methylophilus sp. YYY-1 TaxID=2682087 RepID=UPI0023B2174A|nr:phosphomannomutase [Methylophilus sp. YYY-1]